MDQTHLRFYTLKTAKALFTAAGYDIAHINVTHWNWELPAFVRGLLASRGWEVKQRMARWWPGLLASQFILYARLPEEISRKGE